MSTLKNPEPERPVLSVVRETPEKRLRILLVGDDETSLAKARHILQDLPNAKLKFASTAEEASALVAAMRFDLVVVDPVLPGGFGLLKEVKDKHRWVATLVVTANQTPSFMRQVVKCRIDGLLFRPITAEDFVEQVVLLAKAVSMRRLRQQKRVLAIGAHPDDVEIGCGGAMAKHHAAGDVLHILTLSRGAAGGDTNVRTAEAQRAAALFGAALHMGSLRDTYVTDGRETIEIIQSVIREMNPTHVYTHSLEDTHQDHRAVHAASLVAARGVPNLYCYQTPSSTVEFRPHRFVDITDFIGAKLQAIDAYGSQSERMVALEPDNILATARYWGRFAGYVMAEPMRIVRQRDNEQGLEFDKAGLDHGQLEGQR
jgi:LmbE family N-acetylglucosaminyl deacetylase